MRVRQPYGRPAEKRALQRRAVVLEWTSIGFILSIIVVVFATMGSSQAMKAAWVEDLLSLVPPLSFLVAMRFQGRPPDERFPYGYHRAFSISFLVAATALFGFGLYILFDSVMALVTKEHPTIGTMRVFGRDVWAGWLMIAALTYSAIPPVVLGRLKQPLSRELHAKTLHADAEMNRADWLTAVAGILGILGLAAGWWWADAVAAGVISVDIVRDGVTNLRHVVGDLMDRRPVTVDRSVPDEIVDRVRDALRALPWVADADVRLREEGDVLNGEAYVVPRDEADLIARFEEAGDAIRAVHWRIYDVVVTAVGALEQERGRAEEAGR